MDEKTKIVTDFIIRDTKRYQKLLKENEDYRIKYEDKIKKTKLAKKIVFLLTAVSCMIKIPKFYNYDILMDFICFNLGLNVYLGFQMREFFLKSQLDILDTFENLYIDQHLLTQEIMIDILGPKEKNKVKKDIVNDNLSIGYFLFTYF